MEGEGNISTPFHITNCFHKESSNSNNLDLNLEIGDWLSPLIDEAQTSQWPNSPIAFEGATHGTLFGGLDLNAPSIYSPSNDIVFGLETKGHVVEEISNQDHLVEDRQLSLRRRVEEASGFFFGECSNSTPFGVHLTRQIESLQRNGIMQHEQNSMMNAPEFMIPELEGKDLVAHMRGAFPGLSVNNYAPRNSSESSMFRPLSSRFLHQEMEVSIKGGNSSSSQPPLRIGPTMTDDRQVGRSQILQSLATTDNQRILSFQVQNAFQFFHKDFTVSNTSMLNGLPDDDKETKDENEGMHLDVDNTSYKEILALEEQIGDGPTGLLKDIILARLRRRIYLYVVDGPREPEPCYVCQEDYVTGDELGQLDCGHDYHFNCIKQWLAQKNSCPICKKIALNN